MSSEVAGEWGRRLDPRPRLTKRSFAQRVERLRDRAFLIVQCAVGGAIAWSLARYLLGHPQPFFAPVTVLVALGLTYGQRLRRVVELTVGVAIGVLVGDVFVHFFGTGPVQLAVVVLCSMSIAVLAGAGGLMMIQAGVQSMIVTTLVADSEYAFSRWLDAVVGGCVALLAATITPTSPVRRPRVEAARVLTELAEVLRATATAGRRRDQQRADDALARARASEGHLADLREAVDEGIAVTRQSPFRRRHNASVVAIADLTEPLDRAIRNIRVLVRRVSVAVLEGEPIPPAYLTAVDDLAQVMDQMADELSERRVPQNVRPALLLLADDTATRSIAGTGRTSLSGEVIRAQLRSIVVDLLMLTGWSYEKVRAEVPYRSDELDD
ncbi:FUSC family protein [Barrientosiimonas endolithica]|uniref:Integral membrane bound transporter domain-containing protein n=1 Tax=Barrientosiimonas endolithica TaxID=1535208 RepID=A0ABN6YL72_9MICO|nr:FUSC family protein [Barrientosiimonas endolithica]BDZ58252.1 hypothetical protein GCM10025872_19090 [Barrientosiimonas endolithica]